ncbi:MAG TPA: FliM/FliN family flagellar motor switch protein [Bryobacteraceae bacterium]|nr:FliM/FliN family flagellar motor switch protein [Bryobacteraceae bacterium]
MSEHPPAPAGPPALGLLLDIELPVTLRFGQRSMTLDEVLSLENGSIVEFERAVEDPIEVLVNDRVVARGAAVTVDGQYGVRILEIAGPRDRMNPVRAVRPRPAAGA